MKYLVRRVLMMVPVLVLISIIGFCLAFVLPGDPAEAILPDDLQGDKVAYEALRAELGLDRSVAVQYGLWAKRALTGDFGVSTRNGQPVTDAIIARLAPTVELTVLSLLWAVVFGIPVGIYSAMRPNSLGDVFGSMFAVGGVALPNFWQGVMLILVLSVWLRWLPSSGYVSPFEDLSENLRLMLLPSFTLSSFLMAVIMRQTRSSLLEVMQQDYIRTARAKGLGEWTTVVRHALKNALIPVVTVIGYQMGHQLGGSIVVETVFGIPGAGRLIADSIFYRDFPMVTGLVMMAALAVIACNLIADLMYAYLDPRIRYA